MAWSLQTPAPLNEAGHDVRHGAVRRQRRQQIHSSSEGRLRARPMQSEGPAALGLSQLGIDHPRDGLLYVPGSYDPAQPAPLIVMLHGAGGNAHHGIAPLLQLAEAAGVILLAPESRRQTWDVLYGEYGADVA